MVYVPNVFVPFLAPNSANEFFCLQRTFTAKCVSGSVPAKRFRRFWLWVHFLEKWFWRLRFPVPGRFLGHSVNRLVPFWNLFKHSLRGGMKEFVANPCPGWLNCGGKQPQGDSSRVLECWMGECHATCSARYHWIFQGTRTLKLFLNSFWLNNLHLHFSNFQSYTLEILRILLRVYNVFPAGSVSVLFSPCCVSQTRGIYKNHTYISESSGD